MAAAMSSGHGQPPCAYARAIMYILSVVGGLAVFIAPFLMSRLSATEDQIRAQDRSVTELQADLKYVRASVDEIKMTLRRREFTSTPGKE